MRVNASVIPQQARQHQLGAVADSVDSRVLDHKTLVRAEQRLERLNDLAQVRLVATVVVLPLRVEHVVQRNQGAVVLGHNAGAHAAELLHVGAHAEQQTQVHAERPDVGAGLARHPEDAEVAVVVELDQLALVNGADTELALDGRDEGRALEEGTGEGLEGLGKGSLAAGNLVVEADDGHVLLTGTLLGLDEAGGAVNADNWFWLAKPPRKDHFTQSGPRTQAAGDLGIEGTGVTSLLHTAKPVSAVILILHPDVHVPKHPLHPSNNLVRRGVRRLVEVDDTAGDVGLDVPLVGRRAIGDGGEVAGPDKHLVVVLEQQRPVARVERRHRVLRLDHVLLVAIVPPFLHQRSRVRHCEGRGVLSG